MDIVSSIQSGSASVTYLALAGLLLGGLHGLEPGHSKTMMAAFIIAVRGTVTQAVLLGVSAAVSHSLIVWLLAALALQYGDELIGEKLGPYLLLVSAIIIFTIGLAMLWRARRQQHLHHHDQAHPHHPDHHRQKHHHADQDTHARAHAEEMEQRFANGQASIAQTIGFGLTGGLIPCPAAITVLLLCLHIGQIELGITLVAAFSIGLALTLVLVGVTAAVGLNYARQRFVKIDGIYRAAPFASGFIILLIGAYLGYSGFIHLPA